MEKIKMVIENDTQSSMDCILFGEVEGTKLNTLFTEPITSISNVEEYEKFKAKWNEAGTVVQFNATLKLKEGLTSKPLVCFMGVSSGGPCNFQRQIAALSGDGARTQNEGQLLRTDKRTFLFFTCGIGMILEIEIWHKAVGEQ